MVGRASPCLSYFPPVASGSVLADVPSPFAIYIPIYDFSFDIFSWRCGITAALCIHANFRALNGDL